MYWSKPAIYSSKWGAPYERIWFLPGTPRTSLPSFQNQLVNEPCGNTQLILTEGRSWKNLPHVPCITSIYLYIYHKFMPNIGKYSSPIEHMGLLFVTFLVSEKPRLLFLSENTSKRKFGNHLDAFFQNAVRVLFLLSWPVKLTDWINGFCRFERISSPYWQYVLLCAAYIPGICWLLGDHIIPITYYQNQNPMMNWGGKIP